MNKELEAVIDSLSYEHNSAMMAQFYLYIRDPSDARGHRKTMPKTLTASQRKLWKEGRRQAEISRRRDAMQVVWSAPLTGTEKLRANMRLSKRREARVAADRQDLNQQASPR